MFMRLSHFPVPALPFGMVTIVKIPIIVESFKKKRKEKNHEKRNRSNVLWTD